MASQALTKGALWMQNVDYPALWDRTLIDALWTAEGVIDGFAVSPSSGLTISIAGGRAIVSGDDTAANTGKYLVDQDGAVTVTVAAVGSTRTEYVWISVNDTAVAGGRAGNNVTIETSTTAPPASALLIATLSLTSGTSTITAGMIADSRVYTSVIAPSSVVTSMLADSAVTSAKIADGTIATADIADAAVATAKIADNAITTAKIAAGAVGTTDIADAAVTLAKLEATLQTRIDAMDPADAIVAIGGSTAPTGWALCDGAPYSRTTYAATYARIGTTYGVGDGSTTFNVPDLRNRFIAGKGPTAWSDTLNESSGSKDAIAVAHTHTINHGHGHNISATTPGGGGTHAHTETGGGSQYGWLYIQPPNGVNYDPYIASGVGGDRGGIQYTQPSTGTGGSGHNHTVNVAGSVTDVTPGTLTGGNPTGVATDANLPPFRVLNYAIRLR